MRRKNLAISFLTALALLMTGTATAQDTPTEDWNYSATANGVDAGNGLVVYGDGDTVNVRDYDGNLQFSDGTGYHLVNDAYITDSHIYVTGGTASGNSDGYLNRYQHDGTLDYSSTWTDDNNGYGAKGNALDVVNDSVYIATSDNQVMKINATTGSEVNFNPISQSAIAVEYHAPTDSVFMGDNQGTVYKFSSDLSTQETSNSIAGNNIRGLYTDSNGDIAYASSTGEIGKMDSSVTSITSTSTGLSSMSDMELDSGSMYIANGTHVSERDYSDLTNVWTLENVDTGIRAVSADSSNVFIAGSNNVKAFSTFTLPQSVTVSDDTTNLVTGDFALTSSAGVVTAVKGISGIGAGLATWELGVRDWLFGTNDADKQLWKDDIRANAVTLEDNRKNILNASEISNDALFGDAMAEARAQGVQAFNNNKTKSEAKTQIENTVEDYYSDVERTVINGYNNEVLNLQNDYNNAQSIGVSFDSVFKSNFNDLAVVNETYTLPNGENIDTYYVVTDSGTRIMTVDNSNGAGLVTESTANHSSSQYVSGSAHYDLIQDVRTTRSNAITNVNSIVDNIYNNYQSGNISVSDELSALELVEGLSTDYSSTGSYDYASALLARSGQPTDLESAFEISYNGENMTGALFASDAVVNGTVEAGQSYDGSQGNAVFVKQGDTEAELIDLTGTFTVNSITNVNDGSSLNSTELQENTAYSSSITDLQEEIDALQTQLDNTGNTGGGFLGGIGSSSYAIIALVLVLIGVVLA